MNFRAILIFGILVCNITQAQVSINRNYNLQLSEDSATALNLERSLKASVNRHFSFYVMSAFLCEKAIESHGFENALQLIYSGRRGENFFKNLKEVLNVDESNFHETIVKLIHEE